MKMYFITDIVLRFICSCQLMYRMVYRDCMIRIMCKCSKKKKLTKTNYGTKSLYLAFTF